MKTRLTLFITALALTAAPAFAQNYALWTNLVSYWPLDTVNVSTTPDVSLGNDLPLLGATPPSLATGQFNSCLQLDGVSGFLGLIHTTSALDTGLPIYSTNGYTIAFWVKATATAAGNNHTIFAEGISGNTGPLFNIASQTGGKIRVFLRNDANAPLLNNVVSTSVVFDGNWHHVAWVDTNGAAKLYIDGTQDATSFIYTAGGGPTLNNTSIGALYRTPPANYLNAQVDDLALWKRVLSQSEIQSLIVNSVPQPIPATLPAISAQPANSTNALGDRATFVTHVYGTRPITVQWYSNNVAIPDQTNNTLTLISLTTPATNSYYLVATNVAGSVTSNPALLVVLPDAPPNVASGLVSYWPFDTVTNSPNTNSPDLYSQDNLVLNNGMDTNNLVAGPFGNALNFDGVTNYGSLSAVVTPVYDLTSTFTVAFWVKGLAGQTNRQIFANGNTTNAADFFFIGSDNTGQSGKLDVKVSPGLGDTLSAAAPLDGTWHHIVWVDQNGTGLLYVDGVLDASLFKYTHGSLPVNTTSIGGLLRSSAANFFGGAVDDLAIWSRRLSYTEIQSVRTTGVPAPTSVVLPAIGSLTTQPANLTNGIYPNDTVVFTVAATGTPPLSYFWQKNGSPISGATTNSFTLPSVQTFDSAGYSVVVTNSGGAITSSVVVLSVTPYTPATNGTVLQVEFNFAAQPIIQPAFSSMTLLGNPATFNGPKVTLSAIGATSLSDRSRTAVSNNPPALTQAALYNQFIFSTSSSFGTGIDIHVQRLAPHTTFGITLWSWDNANRVTADWTEVSSGTPVPVQTAYFFNGSLLPVADDDDTLGALVTSSATGELELQGMVESGTSGIFINALRLIANPIIRIVSSGITTNGTFEITVETQYPNQQIEFQDNAGLDPSGWAPSSDLISTVVHGPMVTAEFSITVAQKFFRVVSP